MRDSAMRDSADDVNPNSMSLPTRAQVEEHSLGMHAHDQLVRTTTNRRGTELSNMKRKECDEHRVPSLMTYGR